MCVRVVHPLSTFETSRSFHSVCSSPACRHYDLLVKAVCYARRSVIKQHLASSLTRSVLGCFFKFFFFFFVSERPRPLTAACYGKPVEHLFIQSSLVSTYPVDHVSTPTTFTFHSPDFTSRPLVVQTAFFDDLSLYSPTN